MRKVNFLVSVAVLAMAAPAWAQETPKPADEAGAETAGDIIVTATRRSESLSNVPIAISAVSGETLKNSGASDVRALNQVAPSLLVSGATSEVSFSARIRGVGTVGENAGLESSVGLFIDGVYRSRTGVGLSELGDIERIEVLRGPQGTLFGKNSTSGLLNIVTKGPQFKYEGNASATYGNYNYVRIDGSVTGPLSQTVAAKLDAVYQNRDGFTKNLTPNEKDSNDRNRYLVRGQLLFQPSSDLSVRLIGDYTKRNEICCAAPYLGPARNVSRDAQGNIVIGPNTLLPLLNALGARINVGVPFNRSVATTPGFNYPSNTEDFGFSGELNWNLGGAKLTSITAYRDFFNQRGQDSDFNALDILRRTDQEQRFRLFSQELRLQGSLFDNRLDWLVGGYYSNERLNTADDIKFGNDAELYFNCLIVAGNPLLAPTLNVASPTCSNAPATTFGGLQAAATAFGASRLGGTGIVKADFKQDTRSYAIFTHNVINIIEDKVSLTLGGRYTNERKRVSSAIVTNNNLCRALRNATNPLAAFACGAVNDTAGPGFGAEDPGSRRTDSEFTGTAVLSYKPIKDVLIYGSYSRGFKAGGFNLDIAGLDPTCNPNTGTAAQQADCQRRQGLPANRPGNATPEAADLQFQAEKVDAYEIGVKVKRHNFSVNAAAFLQYYTNFQLNTFNGVSFEVTNIGSCKDNLSNTGSCAAGRSRPGVRSRGFEIEGFASPLPAVDVNIGFTFSDTKYRANLTGSGGNPLSAALFQLPGRQISNAPRYVVTGGIGYSPELGIAGLSGLLYVNARYQSATNTGSDLDIEKVQKGFVLVNGRIGVYTPEKRFGVEIFAQNIFNKKYQQIAADAPAQGSGTLRGTQLFGTTANQLYIAFPGEPRTYGITVRGKF